MPSAVELQTVGLPTNEIGLFLDVDGTLLDLAARPEAVTVPQELTEALGLANERLDGAIAMISGRPIQDLDILFAPLKLRASGVHGAEIRYAPGEAIEALASTPLPERGWRQLAELLEKFPGTYAEDKRVSYAVHFRMEEAEESEFLVALEALVIGLDNPEIEMLRGRRVVEIKPKGFDKGQAIERFMRRPPFAGRVPVFIADEEVDRAGFKMAMTLGGKAFSVGEPPLPDLSGSFSHPAAVREWLCGLGR